MLRFKQFIIEATISDQQKANFEKLAMNPSGNKTPTPVKVNDIAIEGGRKYSRTHNPLQLSGDRYQSPEEINRYKDQQDHQEHRGDEESEEAIRTHLDNAGYMGAYDAAGEIAKQAIGGSVGKVAGAVIGPVVPLALGDLPSAVMSVAGKVASPAWGGLNFNIQKAYGSPIRTSDDVSPEEQQQTEAKKNKEAKQRQFSREVMNPSGADVPSAHITNWAAQQRKY